MAAVAHQMQRRLELNADRDGRLHDFGEQLDGAGKAPGRPPSLLSPIGGDRHWKLGLDHEIGQIYRFPATQLGTIAEIQVLG